jgi:hypothetical protein
VVFRADAAFAKPELYEALEERKVKYTIRLPANDNLERRVAQLLKRPVGRPSYKPVVRYRSFYYQAASWKSARRVVAKVEFHFGELFPRVGFIVTNFQTSSRAVVRFYNKRSLPPPRHSSRECHLFVTPGEYAAPIRNVQTSQSGGEDSATTQKCSGDLRSNKIKGARTRYAHRRRYGRLDRNGCFVD